MHPESCICGMIQATNGRDRTLQPVRIGGPPMRRFVDGRGCRRMAHRERFVSPGADTRPSACPPARPHPRRPYFRRHHARSGCRIATLARSHAVVEAFRRSIDQPSRPRSERQIVRRHAAPSTPEWLRVLRPVRERQSGPLDDSLSAGCHLLAELTSDPAAQAIRVERDAARRTQEHPNAHLVFHAGASRWTVDDTNHLISFVRAARIAYQPRRHRPGADVRSAGCAAAPRADRVGHIRDAGRIHVGSQRQADGSPPAVFDEERDPFRHRREVLGVFGCLPDHQSLVRHRRILNRPSQAR